MDQTTAWVSMESCCWDIARSVPHEATAVRVGFIATPMTAIQDLESLDRTKMIKPGDVAEAALLPFKVRPNPDPDPSPHLQTLICCGSSSYGLAERTSHDQPVHGMTQARYTGGQGRRGGLRFPLSSS